MVGQSQCGAGGLFVSPTAMGEKTVEMARGFSPYGPEPFSGGKSLE